MYALIEFAGKQFKVEEGSFIKVPRVKGEIGTKVTIDKLLYLEEGDKKTIGSPFVIGKKLDGEIVSHGRGRKIVVFKFKRRKGYQKKNTHCDEYTILQFNKLGTVKKSAVAKKITTPATKKTADKKEPLKKVVSKKEKKTTTKKSSVKKTSEAKKEKE